MREANTLLTTYGSTSVARLIATAVTGAAGANVSSGLTGLARGTAVNILQGLAEALRVPFDGPTVVVTHHLPHPKSIHPRYAGDPLTPAFCSNLSELVENSGEALWVHGHTHASCDYFAGQTRVVCNPKGYGPVRTGGEYENPDFDAGMVVKIDHRPMASTFQ